MKAIKPKSPLKELQKIPGVGQIIAQDLWNLGITCIEDLKGKNPEQLYQQLCEDKDSKVDSCMLYVLRCAVYYASNTQYDAELLKWWNWKTRSE